MVTGTASKAQTAKKASKMQLLGHPLHRLTNTYDNPSGHIGDAINVAFIGSEEELTTCFLCQAGMQLIQ